MTDNLETLTDAQLSEVFAVEVVGDNEERHQYATSADAVLPWLDKAPWVGINRSTSQVRGVWGVGIGDDGDFTPVHCGYAPTFARAACIALIRAKRAEHR